MSDTVVQALIGAVPATLAALAALLVGLRTNAKVDVVAGHVNSAAAASVTKIEGLQEELKQMRGELASQKETAAMLAQTTALLRGKAEERPRARK